jgi:hypothetical protein
MVSKITIYTNIFYTLIVGLTFSFAPGNFLLAIGETDTELSTMFVQTIGAFFISYAGMNWMAKDSVLGGIYGKSLTFGNTLFYVMTAFMSYKLSSFSTVIIGFSVLHTFFAVSYYMMMSTNPVKVNA